MRKWKTLFLIVALAALFDGAWGFGEELKNGPAVREPERKYLNFVPELAAGAKPDFIPGGFKSVNDWQNVCDLQRGDSNTCALAFDRHQYAYIGCNITPARIVKFDLKTMKELSHIDLPAGEGRDECRVAALIAIDSGAVIHGSYTNPCVFTKIDGNTMRITGTLRGTVEDVNDKYIRSMTFDGEYVYAATDSIPSKIIKINPREMTKVDEVTFTGLPIDCVTAITICNDYIVGVSGRDEDNMAAVFRVSLADLHKKPEYILIPSHAKYHSICTDGVNIYAGTFTDPIKVVKVDCSAAAMKFAAAFEGEKINETGNFSIVYDGKDVIAGTWNLDPLKIDKLIKLDVNTMRRKATMNLPTKFPADLMYLEPYFYTSCDQPIGRVVRVRF